MSCYEGTPKICHGRLILSFCTDMRMHLAVTDYGNFLQNEPSPLQTLTISERCTEKLVEEFNYLRCNSSAELAKFLDYITYVLVAAIAIDMTALD